MVNSLDLPVNTTVHKCMYSMKSSYKSITISVYSLCVNTLCAEVYVPKRVLIHNYNIAFSVSRYSIGIPVYNLGTNLKSKLLPTKRNLHLSLQRLSLRGVPFQSTSLLQVQYYSFWCFKI